VIREESDTGWIRTSDLQLRRLFFDLSMSERDLNSAARSSENIAVEKNLNNRRKRDDHRAYEYHELF
jgi:hypothetical protein